MFQLKISAALVAVLLLVTSAVYVYLTGHIEQDILINEYDEITFSSRAILNNKRLAETSLRLQAESLAREEQFNAQFHTFRQKVIQSAYPNEQALLQNLSASPERQAFWDYLTQWRSRRAAPAAGYQEKNRNILSTHQTRSNPEEWFANQPDLLLVFLVLKEGVPPCLVSYVDQKQNKVVGCNYPNLNQSLNDVARTKVSAFDVNDWNSKDYAIVITPILTGDKQVAGMIVVGYQVSNELVTKLSAPLSDQQIVMVYHKGTIYTDQAEAKSALTSSQMQLLLASNRDIEPEGDDNVSFKTAKSNQVYSLEFGDEPQLFTRVPWFGPEERPNSDTALFIVSPLTEANLPLSRTQNTLPLMGLFSLVGALVVCLLLLQRFAKPFEEIEAGIREVLQGNKDYTFQVSRGQSVHQDLCAGLNQMSAFLQGKSNSDDENSEEGWDRLMVDLEPERPSLYGLQAVGAPSLAKPAATSDSPAASSSDPEAEKMRPLYEEYMNARTSNGQHVDMDFDRFVRRLKRNEDSLKAKHGCKSVEFSIAVNDGKVVLKPKLNYS
jgi:hypothetical protein